MPKTITIRTDGTIQALHDDRLIGLYRQGQTTLRRASHVEPWEELSEDAVEWLKANRGIDLNAGEELNADWWADLQPVNGGVLGPFTTRTAALAAEEDWINKNILTRSTT